MGAAIGRRGFLGGLASATAAGASATAGGASAATTDAETHDERFDVADWRLPGSADLSRRALVLVPRGLAPDQRVPMLVLLHGLGETSNETAGVRAWLDRYGLLSSHARLTRPPVGPESGRGDLTAARAGEINDALRARPFVGRTIFVCPFTPNVPRLPDPSRALDRLTSWIAEVLLPEVRKRTPASTLVQQTGISGCSLGGYLGLEIFLKRPGLFGAWSGVQSALREASAPRWAERTADAQRASGPRRMHIVTSRRDPFHDANVAFSRELTRRGVSSDLTVSPGPHDQPWLREAGTLEMLLWHDRALSGT